MIQCRTELDDNRCLIYVKERDITTETINNPVTIVDFMNKHFHTDRLSSENVFAIFYDQRLQPISISHIGIGEVNTSIVSIRQICSIALMSNASSVVLIHNHPSGNTEPSGEDCEVTKKVNNALQMFGIHLVDHIVIGTGYTSFHERRLI